MPISNKMVAVLVKWQNKPTTEALKCRQHPHQSVLQDCPFMHLQKTIWTDKITEKNEKSATGQNPPTTIPSFATHQSHYQKDPNEDQTDQTTKPKHSNKQMMIPVINETDTEPFASACDMPNSGQNLSTLGTQLSWAQRENPIFNGW